MPVNRTVIAIAPIPPELEAHLAARFDLRHERLGTGTSMPGIRVIVTTSMAGADEAVMDAFPDLALIACNGTGLDKIDLAAAAARGVTVQHTPDIVTEDTADFAVGLMYATSRRIAEADRFVRSGRWRTERMTPSRRLYSRTVGIVGLGNIGSAIARRAAGIGMTVLYTGPREKPDVPYAYRRDVVTLAREADILVLSCPGGPATHHLVGAEVLEALGSEGILINVSRGSVVQQEPLLAALENGIIAGAGLDVFESEPDIDPRFFKLENAVLQPHYAAVTRETRQAMADLLGATIARYFDTAISA